MLRYLFMPRLSLFDITSLAFVVGSIPFIGYWALLAAFVLILTSSTIEVVLINQKASSAFPTEEALGEWTMKPSRSCALCAEWTGDDCAPGRIGLCQGFSKWSAKK
jgi:hypothetical protein